MVSRGTLLKLAEQMKDQLTVREQKHLHERDHLFSQHRIAAADQQQQRAEALAEARAVVGEMWDRFLAEHE